MPKSELIKILVDLFDNGEETRFLFSFITRYMIEAPRTKDRSIKEKHMNLFNINFRWNRSPEKWKPKETGKLGHFYAKFDEEKDSHWTKGV